MDLIQENLTVVILAGGKSSRFGSPKELARFDESRLIDISIKIAEELTSNVFIISKNNFLMFSRNLPVYSDLVPNCGPLGGIYSALHFSQNNWIATIPCDMPLLNPEIYRYLFSKRKNKLPIVAKSENGLEPLVAIWHKDSFEIIKCKIQNKKFSTRNCQSELEVIKVDVTQMKNYKNEWFFNVNYKRDLELLSKIAIKK
jgi:molybdenum cofactor guanylyltransferase